MAKPAMKIPARPAVTLPLQPPRPRPQPPLRPPRPRPQQACRCSPASQSAMTVGGVVTKANAPIPSAPWRQSTSRRQKRFSAGEGLPKERFEEIPNLWTHAPWDANDYKRKKKKRQKKRARSTHRCGVCMALGPVFGKNNDLFRGDVQEPRRAKLICIHPGCVPNYCSAACFNKWHRNQELPDIMKADFDGAKGLGGLYLGGTVGEEEEEEEEEEEVGGGGGPRFIFRGAR
jgi:hypothetical protein